MKSVLTKKFGREAQISCTMYLIWSYKTKTHYSASSTGCFFVISFNFSEIQVIAVKVVKTLFTMVSVCLLTEPQVFVRFDIWEQGNISPLQLNDKLQGALRHALCDVLMELRVLPNPLCLGVPSTAKRDQRQEPKGEVIVEIVFISLPLKDNPINKTPNK